ncbi:MAG: response regulator [Anaerolineaceae bacterium]|nr:MAG: response regulator [Anaerolineaceae bacterium]
MVLAMVCQMLTSLAYDVQEADHGLEALTLFEKEKFDLVLTDIQMPYMDGWELDPPGQVPGAWHACDRNDRHGSDGHKILWIATRPGSGD